MSTITPSVGRKVWYYEGREQPVGDSPDTYDAFAPWDATVIKVHGLPHEHSAFSQVNLLVVNPDTGEQYFVERVAYSPTRVPMPHFAWMPYQEAQAARQSMTEQMQKMYPGHFNQAEGKTLSAVSKAIAPHY